MSTANTTLVNIMNNMRLTTRSLLPGLLMLLLSLSVQAADVAIKELDFSSLPGDKVQIFVKGTGNLPKPTSFTTDNPARLAIDFANVSSQLPKMSQAIGIGTARSILALEAGTRTRLIVNLTGATKYDIDVNGNQAIITLSGGSDEALATAKPAASPTPTPTPMKKTTAQKTGTQALRKKPSEMAATGRRINNIDFRRGASGEGRLLVTLSDPTTVVDMKRQGNDVVVNFVGAKLPQRLMRKLDVIDFATPAQFVESTPVQGNTRITIKAKGDYEHLAYQTDNQYVVELRAMTKREIERIREKTYTGERLSLNFQDIEIRSVLQLLADFTGLNLVVSDTVSGNITLRLQNVPWDHALDIILKTRGLSMRRKDNVVLIAPTEEIAARERLELESQKAIEELAPLRTEWIRLNYANAEDIANLIGAVGATTNTTVTTGSGTSSEQLLSARGSVTFDARTNTLLVKETASKLEEIRDLIRVLDVPVRQVLIESRVVIANDDFSKDLGVKWAAASSHPNYDHPGFSENTSAVVGGGIEGDLDMSAISGPFIVTGDSGNENLMVNLPVASPTSAINFVIGKLGHHILRLELSAMESEGKGEIISSPRLITSDQTQATIKQGVEIPYREASSSGAATASFKEAVLQLDVTPHITPDDKVKMELKITDDQLGELYEGIIPTIDKREVVTTVLVDNGETVVLGGVFERTKSLNRDKVPVLGDLPVVGRMFRKEATTNDNSELLIFITPKIIKENMAQR